MRYPYSNVVMFPIIYLLGLGLFFVWLEKNLKYICREICKGVGIGFPHINKVFLGSSDTKHKAG